MALLIYFKVAHNPIYLDAIASLVLLILTFHTQSRDASNQKFVISKYAEVLPRTLAITVAYTLTDCLEYNASSIDCRGLEHG